MREVTIPTMFGNPFRVKVNGVGYSFVAGSVVTVEDSVADVIDNLMDLLPRESDKDRAVGSVLTMTDEGPRWLTRTELPDMAGGNANDYLQMTHEGLRWHPLPSATADSKGLVKMSANVAEATSADDVVDTVNAIIGALISAGIMVEPTAESDGT